jgi:glucose-1-phosphate thymidylyltransferase
MKGIVLAGGLGTRLLPLTLHTSKQLLHVYDKPMIYYPVATLMQSGIRELLIISMSRDLDAYKKLLGDGSHLGMHIEYTVQDYPNGIAEAFILGENFIKSDDVALILGDNLFFGDYFNSRLPSLASNNIGASIFTFSVENPSSYGVAEVNNSGKIISIVEKPNNPLSNNAVTGLYFYNNKVVEMAKNLEFSQRGELEITDINNEFIGLKSMTVHNIEDSSFWFDSGTHESLYFSAWHVRDYEIKNKTKIGCIEGIAYKNKWITSKDLNKIIGKYGNSEYSSYLHSLIANEDE